MFAENSGILNESIPFIYFNARDARRTGQGMSAVSGVLLFAILNNGLTLLSISSYWYDVTIGVVIAAAITINAVQQLRSKRKRVRVQIED